jgi:hypothetical protein
MKIMILTPPRDVLGQSAKAGNGVNGVNRERLVEGLLPERDGAGLRAFRSFGASQRAKLATSRSPCSASKCPALPFASRTGRASGEPIPFRRDHRVRANAERQGRLSAAGVRLRHEFSGLRRP